MATPVELPQLGNTVEECVIAKWLKHEGDAVAAGDVVAEVETDKTTFEVTAPVSGIVLATFFDEGAIVPVFTKIFVIGEAGERHRAPRSTSRNRSIAASFECFRVITPADDLVRRESGRIQSTRQPIRGGAQFQTRRHRRHRSRRPRARKRSASGVRSGIWNIFESNRIAAGNRPPHA